MDINANLDELRDLLAEHDYPMGETETDRARELFESLDEWLSRGGFLLDAWSR